MQILMPLAPLLALTACAAFRGSDPPPPSFPPPPASLMLACDSPTHLPERMITQAEAEILWGRDRRALRGCASDHAGLVAWVDALAQAMAKRP